MVDAMVPSAWDGVDVVGVRGEGEGEEAFEGEGVGIWVGSWMGSSFDVGVGFRASADDPEEGAGKGSAASCGFSSVKAVSVFRLEEEEVGRTFGVKEIVPGCDWFLASC